MRIFADVPEIENVQWMRVVSFQTILTYTVHGDALCSLSCNGYTCVYRSRWLLTQRIITCDIISNLFSVILIWVVHRALAKRAKRGGGSGAVSAKAECPRPFLLNNGIDS